jgi:hypothetical protein
MKAGQAIEGALHLLSKNRLLSKIIFTAFLLHNGFKMMSNFG